MRRTPQNQSQLHIDQSDDECNTSSPSQILERVQSDRVTVTKPEEDRRRRTIIVEKKNGSYGFTLQSYGIHYKKEKEIEMITYVDYVDYDGPAYRAGMREGDVILSINGTDMEKADHKTLVNYIKQCDARMRMVVLFEDCVRKVELHMKYIQLQRILQTKMEELDRLCIRERQLLEGKWKTHSLPARKKASHTSSIGGGNGEPSTPTQTSYSYCRPTVSTEDVAKVAAQQQKQSQPLVFAYQYLDSHYRYMLHPSSSSSGEYLLTFEPPRYKEHTSTNFIAKTPCEQSTQQQHQKQSRSQQTTSTTPTNINAEKPPKKSSAISYQHYAGQLCNPCGVQSSTSSNNSNNSNNNGDNTSLDAYDLASPCCDPRCVPINNSASNRRRARNHKDNNSSSQHNLHHQQQQQRNNSRKRDSKTEETQTDPQQQQTSTRSRPTHSQAAGNSAATSNIQAYSVPRRYFHIGAGIVSQCSLHSCTSSEISSNVVATTTTMGGESSANSYTTSLSTDTLYWDGAGSCDNNSRQLSLKSTNSKQQQDTQHHQRYSQVQQPSLQSHQHPEAIYVQYSQVKPKSWDNLATKAFGGYGFGYGYLDMSAKVGQKTCNRLSTKSQGTQYVRVDNNKAVVGNSCSSSSNNGQPQYTPHTHRRYFQPTKSTESLLSVPKYSNEALSDTSSLSCECLDVASAVSPGAETSDIRFFQNPRQSLQLMSPTADHQSSHTNNISSGSGTLGYYSIVRRPTRSSEYKNVVTTSSEATRL